MFPRKTSVWPKTAQIFKKGVIFSSKKAVEIGGDKAAAYVSGDKT